MYEVSGVEEISEEEFVRPRDQFSISSVALSLIARLASTC